MGFFRRLFSDKPEILNIDRNSWVFIANNITKEFAKGRDHWFGELILVFENSIKEHASPINIMRKQLDRDSDNIIKAYQLYLFSELMANKRYIPPASGKDFADILYAQVAGKDLESVVEIFRQYHEVADDAATKVFRFSGDIAKYITGNKAPLIESVLVGSTVPFFTIMTRLVIAESFGDRTLVKELENSMRSLMQ
jgi:hypothetical protein